MLPYRRLHAGTQGKRAASPCRQHAKGPFSASGLRGRRWSRFFAIPKSDGGRSSVTASLFRLFGAVVAALGLLAMSAFAQAPSHQELSRLAPFGAYLAARHAGAERDASAAAAYYRAALRADPNNKELIDRDFLSLL